MALKWADRIADTSTTTGTGNIVVSGSPPLGYETFSSAVSVNDTCHYAVSHRTANEWEVGLGTYSSTNTLVRTQVLASSNNDAAVSFSAGTKDVRLVVPASVISGLMQAKSSWESLGQLSGSIYQTRSLLNADLSKAAASQAWVYGDPTLTNNGVYRKDGGPNVGSWIRVADLPYSVMPITVTGGTANAIVGATPLPLPTAANSFLLILPVSLTNTGNMTLALNGEAVTTFRGLDGEELAPGYIRSGSSYLITKVGSQYRTISDSRVEQLADAAAASAAAAAASAADAEALSPAWLLPQTGPRGGLMSILPRDILMPDDGVWFAGVENLAAWYKALKDSFDGGTSTPVYGFTLGDSKVAGTGAASPFLLDEVMERIGWNRGFTNVDFGRFGYGGKNSYYMLNTALPVLLAHPTGSLSRVVVLNFGTNERVNQPTDSPAQTLAETEANVRAIIDRLRNTGASPPGRDADTMSIILMAQTTASNSNPAYYQDQVHMRELNSLYREIAREKNVVFFDPYMLAQRPHDDASWMDFSISGNVHPSSVFNAYIMSALGELLFPLGLATGAGYGPHNYLTTGKIAAALPSTYPWGSSAYRSVVGSGWALDGTVITYRAAGNICYQVLCDRTATETHYRTSVGSSDAWNSWVVTPKLETADLAWSSGWATLGGSIAPKARKYGNLVQIEGHAVPGTLTINTDICTALPVGMRPARNRFFPCYSNTGFFSAYVTSGGLIRVGFATGTPTTVSLEGICFAID